MSGGHWDYKDSGLKSEIFGWDNEIKNPLGDLEISEVVSDILDLLHDYDWYVSGDTGKDTWDAARKAFKAKWLKGSRTDRLKDLINRKLEETKVELEDLL